jgi:hypothetical protein
MPTKSCLTCGYRNLNPQQCPLIGFQYTEDCNAVCPYWVAEVPTCGICGQVDPQAILTQKSDTSWIRLCRNCAGKSGTCGGCSKSTTCDFETNPSPIPKAVEKRFQQGNQIMITQIKNPDRIAISCRINCECFSEKFGCLRENGTCGNYEDAFECGIF